MRRAMVYGAYGYTGALIARRLLDLGVRPILGGRNAEKLGALAREIGLESRSFSLGDRGSLRAALDGVGVLMNAAGPFVETFGALLDGCLEAGAHYCDITGEIDVFEAVAARGVEAATAGVMLLPGCGFDIVPSDCLLSHVAHRMPDADHLELYVGGSVAVSRGTASTALRTIARGTAVRRDGTIVWLQSIPRKTVDLGDGPVEAVCVPYGDVSTAMRSTSVENIAVFVTGSRALALLTRVPAVVRRLAFGGVGRRLIGAVALRIAAAGPNERQRSTGSATLIAVARNGERVSVSARLTTPEVYSFSADVAAEVVRRALAGDVEPGFQTPSSAFGADFVTSFRDVLRVDV